jgi:hypothetical protein
MQFIQHVTCSQAFRDYLLKALPILQQDIRYLRFVIYLLFGTQYDEDGRGLLISLDTLAALEGKEALRKNHRYVGRQFLLELKAKVLPNLAWHDWEYDLETGQGKVRAICCDGLPEDVVARATAERRHFAPDTERVYLLDGRPVKRHTRMQVRKAQQEQACRSPIPTCPEVASLLSYMNSRPSQIFTKLRKHLPLARVIIESVEKASPKATVAFRRGQYNALHQFDCQPQPFYGVSACARSTRIFACNGGLLMLKSAARKAITQAAGCMDLDLKNAQLAIIAKDWDIPEVYSYLSNGHDLWPDLLQYLEVPYSENLKGKVKKAIYMLVYGAQVVSVKGEVTKALGIAGAGARFVAHPIIQAVIQRREAMRDQVIAQGGMRDCFGRWLAVDAMEGKVEKRAFSILSLCAQARELQLLAPAIDKAIAEDQPDRRWQIVLFQHDGFTVSIRDRKPDRMRKLIAELQRLVQVRADELDIPTRLVWDEEPSVSARAA